MNYKQEKEMVIIVKWIRIPFKDQIIHLHEINYKIVYIKKVIHWEK